MYVGGVQKKSVCLCFGCVAKWHPVTFPHRCACEGEWHSLCACVCVCQHPAPAPRVRVDAWLSTVRPVDPCVLACLPLCHTTRPAEGKRQQLLDNRTFYLNFTHPYLRKIKNQHSGPRLMKILEKRIKAFYHKHLFNM